MGFISDFRSSLDPQYGQKKVYRNVRGDVREATNRYMEMILQRQGIDPAMFTQAAQQAINAGGLQGIQQGYAALPGQFYGQGYASDLQSAILGQANTGALAAGRAAGALGSRRGLQFGGAAEQARRAMTDLSAQTGANLAGARAQTEGARAGLAQASLQGQAGIGGQIAQMLGQAGLAGLGSQQDFNLAQMNALAGLGTSSIGALGGIGSTYIGNSGTGWLQKMIQQWGSSFLGGGGMGMV